MSYFLIFVLVGFFIISTRKLLGMEIGMYEVSLAIVLMYTALGWLVLTGIKLNYGRLSNSMANIYLDPRIGWFVF